MGKVRPEYVKRKARELVELYPDRFSADFQANKEAMKSVAQISSVKLRNRIAGYITRLAAITASDNEEETTEEEEED